MEEIIYLLRLILNNKYEVYFYPDLVRLNILSHSILAYYLEDRQFLTFLQLKKDIHTITSLT